MTNETMPKVVVLDGDIIAYKAAFWAETEGVDALEDRITHDIKAWTPPGVEKVYVAISCPRAENFRRAIWDPYKRHRDDASRKTPDCLPEAIELVTASNKLSIPTLEADDIMGLMASSYKAIAVTIDKDLRSVRGWHWNPDKEAEPVLVDAETAEFNFHKQWLAGDTTDNIPGIWKIGVAKASAILQSVRPEQWTAAVMATYEKRLDCNGEPHSLDYCVKMAQCVRILRDGEYNKETKKPILWYPD